MASASTARRLQRRLWRADLLLLLYPALVGPLYFHFVGRLSLREWAALGVAVAAATLASGVALVVRESRTHAVVVRFGSSLGTKAGPTPELSLQAAAVAARHPASFTIHRCLAWAGGFLVISALMWLQGLDSWLFGRRFWLLASFSAAGLGATACFGPTLVRRALEAVRTAAAPPPDARDGRPSAAPTYGFAMEWQVASVAAVVSVVALLGGIAWQLEARSLAEAAIRWNHAALERIAEGAGHELDLAAPSAPTALQHRVDASLLERGLWPHPVDFSIEDEASLAGGSHFDERDVQSLSAAGASRAGSFREMDSDDPVAWRRLPNGQLLVARTPIASLTASAWTRQLALVGLACVGAGLVLLVARLHADELRSALAELRLAALRIADGDLRAHPVPCAAREFGEVTQAFERLREALYEAVGGMGAAAERVDAASAGLASSSRGIVQANTAQSVRVGEVNHLMARISEQVSSVASAASQLGQSVDDASSSVVELGGAGEQLHSTASVLTRQVEEVSVSIEQMVRSVSQVGESTGDLAEAAIDTSSSMEQMASAMKAVDTSAAKTADLSNEVLSTAEHGRLRVRETIEGMNAIREATDTAERVIRGLGNRTEQIGAILDVIEDVGDETSLLALNAAIIAAQAGEQGRAFSVVADEIKELADRVLASTKEIATVVRAVQGEAANAVAAIEDGSRRVAGGVDLSAEAGISLEAITRAAAESGNRICEIVSAVREQTSAAAHVVQLMDRVSQGVEEIRGASSQQGRANEVVFQSAGTMRDVAQQVRRTTEEQSNGFGRIRDSIEHVRDTVGGIGEALQAQEEACAQALQFLAQVGEGSQAHAASARDMNESMRELSEQSQVLREGVARFRL